MSLPDHPLAGETGLVGVSRKNLYDTVGAGPHSCYWCGHLTDWESALAADHLDGNKDNNDPGNLVASCLPCCSSRRKGKIKAGELTIDTGNGRTRAVQRKCENCGETFLTVPSQIAAGRGRFCSRSCARTTPDMSGAD